MAMNNPYLGQPSGATTVLSNLSLSGGHLSTVTQVIRGAIQSASAVSCGALTATTGTFTGAGDFASTMSIDGNTRAAWIGAAGATFSSTVTCADTAAPLSMLTNAGDADMTIGQLRLVFLASGLSLCYSSGATLYVVNSAQSESQPTT